MSRERPEMTGGRGRSTLRRNRVSLRASVTAVLFLLLFASPATADPCALTDPDCITETAEQNVDKAKDPIADTKETVEQVAGSAGEAVEEAAAGVVGRVNEIVDGLLGRGGKDPGGGGGGQDSPGADRPRGEQGQGDRSPASGRLEPREPSVDPSFPRAGDGLPGGEPVADQGRSGGLGDAARQLAFPALLAILVLAFLVIQNRLDRQDPRLASAPLGPDLLSFE